MIVLNQSLASARMWLASNPPARVDRKRPDGTSYTTVTPREWVRQGGSALALFNLVLCAKESRIVATPWDGPALEQHFTLTHSLSGDVDKWVRVQAVDVDVPLALGASWAETRGLAAAIKALLWDTASEDVPDPSERPSKPEESRTQAQIREEARRAKNGAHLPDRSGEPVSMVMPSTEDLKGAAKWQAMKREEEWRKAAAELAPDTTPLPAGDALPVFPPRGAVDPPTQVIEPHKLKVLGTTAADSHSVNASETSVQIISAASPAAEATGPSASDAGPDLSPTAPASQADGGPAPGATADGGSLTPMDAGDYMPIGGERDRDGPTLTEALAAHGFTHRDSARDRTGGKRDVLDASGTVVLERVAAAEVWAWLRTHDDEPTYDHDPEPIADVDAKACANGCTCERCKARRDGRKPSRNAIDVEEWPPELRGDVWERGFTLQRTVGRPGCMDILKGDEVVAHGLTGPAARAWLHEQEVKDAKDEKAAHAETSTCVRCWGDLGPDGKCPKRECQDVSPEPVVDRDVKPANVLLDPVADRKARAAQWGYRPVRHSKSDHGPCAECDEDVLVGDFYRQGVDGDPKAGRRSKRGTLVGLCHEDCRLVLAEGRDPKSEEGAPVAPAGGAA